jgi:hypothetical protein
MTLRLLRLSELKHLATLAKHIDRPPHHFAVGYLPTLV